MRYTIDIVSAVLCVGSLATTVAFLGPLHASCTVNWTFGKSCQSVSESIVNQINKWHTADNCAGGGERCLYTLVSSSATEIKATHETPVKHYVDDLTFTLVENNSTFCSVKGHSTSETWYAVLDYGTNYCNLENLITGAGLDGSPGYTESTSNSVCTQYSSADCDKY